MNPSFQKWKYVRPIEILFSVSFKYNTPNYLVFNLQKTYFKDWAFEVHSALVSKDSFSKAESRPFITCILGPHLPSFTLKTTFFSKQIVTLNRISKEAHTLSKQFFFAILFSLQYKIAIKNSLWYAIILHTLTIKTKALFLHPFKANFISVHRIRKTLGVSVNTLHKLVFAWKKSRMKWLVLLTFLF